MFVGTRSCFILGGNRLCGEDQEKKLLFSLPASFTSFIFPAYFSLYLHSLSSLYLLFYVSHFLNLSSSSFFHRLLSISLCTPTRSDSDCYTRRIAPSTLTPCCKSFMENAEVFLRGNAYYLWFGLQFVLLPGHRARATVFFLCCFLGCFFVDCCSAGALRFLEGYKEGGRPGSRDYSSKTQTKCRTGIESTGVSIQITISSSCLLSSLH